MWALRLALQALETRIKLLTSLRLDATDRLTAEQKIDEIGHLRVAGSGQPAS
jgi:hypothetical protein